MTTETVSLAEARTQRYRTEDVQSDAGSFTDLLLPQPLVQALAAAGFVRPSPVQKAAIPIGRVGTDLIVQAKSGTGKTAVFATILLDRVDLEVSTPQAIVLAPTRELAIQSYQVIERISVALPQPAPSAAVFVGGLPTADDTKRLRRTCHIAVGSPGRLCGLVTSGALLVGKIKAVVLDEADQLLSEAFYADTAWLLQQLPKRKQVLAFSATYTPELLADLEPLMKRPQKVLLCEETVSLLGIRQFYKLVGSTPSSTHEASSSSSSSAASKHSTSPEQGNNSVLHTDAGPATEPDAASSSAPAAAPADGGGSELPVAASPVQGEGQSDAGQQAAEQPEQQLSIAEQQLLLSLKVDALLQLLSSVSFHQAVVFCNRKPTAEWLSRRLTAAGCPSAHLSSDLPQTERMAAMEAVRTFKVRVIVSTDVMARGVDFDRVNLVVNVDLPPDAATYVHRVGRTGRFGSRGIAIALVSQAELVKLQQHLLDVKGGDIGPLPDEVPADLYRFELSSDWEKTAYQQLLAAPTSTPPDSPPPLRKKKPSKRQQQEQEQEEDAAVDDSAVATSTAAAAALSAFGYDESALSCFDWDEDEAEMQQPAQQQQQQPTQQQQQQQSQMQSVGGTRPAGQQVAAAVAATSAGEYDPAEAWEAWAGYYRSLGYDYPHTNPYLAGAAASRTVPAEQAPASPASVQQHQQQPQPQQQQQQDLPQHVVLGEVVLEGEREEDEDDDEDEWELPDEDDVVDRAKLLLSRLHVTQQAAALAEPTPAGPADRVPAAAPAAAAEGSSGLAAAQAQQQTQQVHSCAVPSAASHHNSQQLQQQATKGEGEGVCWACWSAAYTAWQQQYMTWQQEFSTWCQQYQQQQWQQYSSWCQAYQEQQLDSSQTRPSNRVD